jgi:hypothetical protein
MAPLTTDRLAEALQLARDLLDQDSAHYERGRFGFELAAGWRLAISPDDAERLRVEVVSGAQTCGTMWTRATDHERLAELVTTARDEALALERDDDAEGTLVSVGHRRLRGGLLEPIRARARGRR